MPWLTVVKDFMGAGMSQNRDYLAHESLVLSVNHSMTEVQPGMTEYQGGATTGAMRHS